MGSSIIALYAGGPLGPANIATNLEAVQQAGWTAIILGLFHIGNPANEGQHWGDLIFNDMPAVVSQGTYAADPAWPSHVAALKSSGSVTQVYASVGGGAPVVDFATIKSIYQANANSFAGTDLEKNFQMLRDTFPAIDGIDMDCEETYDAPSFVAFCRMLAGMGFSITFCPYENPFPNEAFWTDALAAVAQSNPGAVKWWNLQCYAGGGGNDPSDWAAEITKAIPSFSTDGFIVAGDWSRWWNARDREWEGDCPTAVTALISGFAAEPCLGGGFIWNMDQILDYGPNKAGCGSVIAMTDYVQAVAKGLG